MNKNSVVFNQHATDSCHWYTREGTPVYEVPRTKPAKDGSTTRPATIADARKALLLPSVTNILKIINNPFISEWRVKDALTWATENKAIVEMGIDSAYSAYTEYSNRHREHGTRMHSIICSFLSSNISKVDQGLPPDVTESELDACKLILNWITEDYGNSLINAFGYKQFYEWPLVNLGEAYAGVIDFWCPRQINSVGIIDFKFVSKERQPLASEAMQGAAYSHFWPHPVITDFTNLYIFQEGEKWKLIAKKWGTKADLDQYKRRFDRAYDLWAEVNDYDLRQNK